MILKTNDQHCEESWLESQGVETHGAHQIFSFKKRKERPVAGVLCVELDDVSPSPALLSQKTSARTILCEVGNPNSGRKSGTREPPRPAQRRAPPCNFLLGGIIRQSPNLL